MYAKYSEMDVFWDRLIDIGKKKGIRRAYALRIPFFFATYFKHGLNGYGKITDRGAKIAA